MRLYSFVFMAVICSGMSGQSGFEQAGLLYDKYLANKDSGQFLEAEAILEEILLNKDELPSYNISLIYNGLGTISWNLGKYKKAAMYYDQAIAKCSGPDQKSVLLLALILDNQAILHMQIGELYTSLDYDQKAEYVLAKTNNKDIRYLDQLSMIYFHKALVLYRLQDYNKAIDLLLESYGMRSRNHLPDLGSIYFNLARSYQEIHEYTLAEEYFQKSINQWINEYDSSYYELGNVYLEYGFFLINQGNHAQGVDNYLHALDIYLANFGPNHTYTASCYNLLADYYRQQNDYHNSLDYIQKALKSICPGFEGDRIYTNPEGEESLLDTRLLKIFRSKVKTLVGYSNSSEGTLQGSPAAILNFALETSKQAVEVLQRIQQSYITQESRLYLAENQKDVFVEGVEVALLLHDLTGEHTYIEEAYRFASMGKTLELSFEKSEKEKLYLENLHDSASAALLDLRKDIDSYTNLIQTEQVKSEPDSVNILTWNDIRFALRREYESKYVEMFGNPIRNSSVRIDFDKDLLHDLQSKLHRKETVIEYSLSNKDTAGNIRLYAFIITKNDCQVYQSTLDASFMNDISTVHECLYDYNPLSSSSLSDNQLELCLSNLYIKLIEPIEQWFKSSYLIIIPDDYLAQIPFDALVKRRHPEGSTSYKPTYLVDEYEIWYYLNSSLFCRSKHPLLKHQSQVKIIAQDYASETTESGVGQYLPSVSSEIKSVLHILKGRRIPSDYSKDEILKEIENGDLLHFALHSSASDEIHPSAYMVINNESDTILNNLLFDYEIDPLQISASLVVLNACESGSGKLYHGEGMLSISRSFILAGAKSVTQTLWPVDDKASLQVITAFYRGIARGWDKSRSLREAKLKYLDETSPSFSHPYYWAGFQIVGDNSPVVIRKTKYALGAAVVLLITLFFAFRIRFRYKGRRNISI